MGKLDFLATSQPHFDFSKEQRHSLHLHRLRNFRSEFLSTRFSVDIFLPPDYDASGASRFPVLFFNDGQDMEAVRLADTLSRLYASQKIPSLIVVAIHAGERLQEYGTAHRPDYRSRGSQAHLYTDFIVKELYPHVRQTYHILKDPRFTAFAGFSLGGLSAMDIVWNNPKLFGKAGVFSGSFWWRHCDFCEDDPDGGRIMHELVDMGLHRPGLQFWFQTGTMDETDDRNRNGVIDSIDDTLDLIELLKNKGYHHKHDIHYREVKDGIHHPHTWGMVLPEFLVWAFGR
ncbi:MAG: esterase family protein [Saprospiraceae bacterium]|jgi:enterochelin esterase-like enzyme|nr:esterase family protein [Saprospiraceae bacterium]